MTKFDRIAFSVEVQKVLEGQGLQEPHQYLFFCFTPEHQPFVVGQMQWSIARKGVSEFAREWAPRQDISALDNMLSQLPPGISMDDLLSEFMDRNRGEHGNEAGGRVAFNILTILLKALLRIRKVKPSIRWEFPELPMQEAEASGICQWLFRR